MPGINDQVAGYRGLVESLAGRYVGRNDAERDDLEQEGLIAVWQALEKKVHPSAEVILARMEDYTRWLGLQIGRGRKSYLEDPPGYNTMMPLGDYENLSLDPLHEIL